MKYTARILKKKKENFPWNKKKKRNKKEKWMLLVNALHSVIKTNMYLDKCFFS